ncbi:MAG: NAD(P)/FAD-dependent oxidoreductase [Kofleriaceae bacterium]|nr:NAD(P)/FAD-dependent oxidoreductase [Myxococcales bacterium]MCB9561746.1 NAD(P)/FAD-dependent oxidoreductase [Kofleriaceae bacterium]MCB9573705.1 NAD(P)/FAD-dependent oxidoreductase [Kofleriaceae bacterium]
MPTTASTATATASAARTEHIVIVGAGFGGLGMAIKLKEAGFDDFTILDKDDGVGGTWRANHYPGAQCDVPSHLYSFSFEPNPRWSRTFPLQPELLAYLEHCADKYDLRRHLVTGAEVVGARFDEATGTWEVEVRDGRRWTARAVVAATGGLSRPKLPELPGRDDFRGPWFHSARWDHDVDLRGKTVAVIGTGASAIQVVPNIVDDVGRLLVFQRTPPWIVPHTDRPIGAREQALFARLPVTQKLARWSTYWQLEWRALAFTRATWMLKAAERLVARHLAAQVADPALRARLRPTYSLGCKRVLISDLYYPALQRPNCELVSDGIAAITPTGIRTVDGQERAVDVIVYCTGFAAADDVAPYPVYGRGGRRLDLEWRDGAEAFLGTTVSGFPNMFTIVGPNTGLGHSSMVFMIESQVAYVMDALAQLRARRWKYVDVRPEAQDVFNQRLQTRLDRTVWNTGGCASWYRAANGKNVTLWPGFTAEYRLRTRRFDPAPYECVADDAGARDRAAPAPGDAPVVTLGAVAAGQ